MIVVHACLLAPGGMACLSHCRGWQINCKCDLNCVCQRLDDVIKSGSHANCVSYKLMFRPELTAFNSKEWRTTTSHSRKQSQSRRAEYVSPDIYIKALHCAPVICKLCPKNVMLQDFSQATLMTRILGLSIILTLVFTTDRRQIESKDLYC